MKKVVCLGFVFLLFLTVVFATDINYIERITPKNTYINISGLMYVSSTNVGIGTPSPSSTLHVVGSATITNGLTVSGGTVSLPAGQIDDAEIADLSWTKLKNYPASCGSGKAIQALGDTLTCVDVNPTNGITGSGTSGRLAKFTGTNTIGDSGISDSSDTVAITIDSSENVGIGTTTPGYKLDVNGQVRIQTLNAGSTNTVVTHSSGVLQTRTIDSRVWGSSLVDYSGTSANYIPKMSDTNTITNSVIYESGGNVGIGTTSPGAKLEVNGLVKKSGAGSIYTYENLGSDFDSGSVTGATVITTNLDTTDTGIWLSDVEITIYSYESPKNQAEIHLSFYKYNGGSYFYNYGYTREGSIVPLIRLGLNPSGKVVIIIGETTSTWSYLQVKVNRVNSNSNDASKFTGWTVTNGVTDLTGYTQLTTVYEKNYFPGSGVWTPSGDVGIGTTSPSQKLDVRGSVYVSGSVGIGTTSPSYKLDVSGTARITGATYLENSKCPSGQVLTADTSTGLVSCTDISGVGGVTGTGTANYIAKWNGTSSITNSVIYESGGNVGIGTTSPSYKLDVNGQVRIQTLNAGSTNTVVTHSSGVLQTRTIDSRVWGSSLVDYSGTSANYIPKMSDTNTITNSVIYESGGNVGIGTTSPSGKLDVRGDEVRIWSGTGSVNYATGAGDLYVQDTAEVDGDLRVGGTIYGDGSGITNLPSASVQDVWVNESGDTMTGDLDMNSNDIINANLIHAKSLGIADTYTNAVNNLPAGNSLYVQDDIKVGGNIKGYGADVAEKFHIKGDLEPGDVVIITHYQGVEKASKPYDTRVAGIISTKPAYIMAIGREGLPIALAGSTPVKVTNESGPIHYGDLLTTSSTPGYAMKCPDIELCRGAIIGKALEEFNASQGIISALVMLG